MEEMSFKPAAAAPAAQAGHAVSWHDLRDWIGLIEQHGLLKRVAAPVDLDEELSAITFLATRAEDAPALLFERPTGAEPGHAVLANMLGASKERYALAMGIDPA